MNHETLLLRQVNPAWVQQGQITSQVFRPTPKDEKQLSVYDGDLISPEHSWIHFTRIQRLKSFGVMAVSVSECNAQGLAVRSDPEPFPEHALIDYSDLAENQIKTKAKCLKAAAESRGWMFQSSAES